MDPYQKVSPGEPVRGRLKAEAWNAMLEAAAAYRRGALGSQGGFTPSPIEPVLEVIVRNDTGADLPARSVVELDESIVSAVDFPGDVQRRPTFTAIAPTGSDVPFAILLEPIPADQYGRAAVAGVVVVDVDVLDSSHTRAGPVLGETATLGTSDGGPAKIIDREAGSSGVKRATVLFDGSGSPGGSTQYDQTARVVSGPSSGEYVIQPVRYDGTSWGDSGGTLTGCRPVQFGTSDPPDIQAPTRVHWWRNADGVVEFKPAALASASQTGEVTPAAQTLGGVKTFAAGTDGGRGASFPTSGAGGDGSLLVAGLGSTSQVLSAGDLSPVLVVGPALVSGPSGNVYAAQSWGTAVGVAFAAAAYSDGDSSYDGYAAYKMPVFWNVVDPVGHDPAPHWCEVGPIAVPDVAPDVFPERPELTEWLQVSPYLDASLVGSSGPPSANAGPGFQPPIRWSPTYGPPASRAGQWEYLIARSINGRIVQTQWWRASDTQTDTPYTDGLAYELPPPRVRMDSETELNDATYLGTACDTIVMVDTRAGDVTVTPPFNPYDSETPPDPGPTPNWRWTLFVRSSGGGAVHFGGALPSIPAGVGFGWALFAGGFLVGHGPIDPATLTGTIDGEDIG